MTKIEEMGGQHINEIMRDNEIQEMGSSHINEIMRDNEIHQVIVYQKKKIHQLIENSFIYDGKEEDRKKIKSYRNIRSI